MRAAASLIAAAVAIAVAARADTSQINAAFREHVRTLNVDKSAVEAVERAWKQAEQEGSTEGFIPDALALLDPGYAAALRDFDDERYADAMKKFDALRSSRDPYLSANARYFHVRAMIEQGLLEEAREPLEAATSAEVDAARYTPYAPHLWLLRGYCEASNLRHEQARAILTELQNRFSDAPESVRIGTRQLLLEIERREQGTLEEVGEYLRYAAARLRAEDRTERVRRSQDDAVALLDKLIEQTRQQEQQDQQSSSGNRGGRGERRSAQRLPNSPAEQSEVAPGAVGETNLHGVDKADPAEMWGKLPPAEREKILQSLRARFPSRYRSLVEQYYRSLAEQK